MACFTKTQQRNRTNCEFEKYVTMSNFFVLNSLAKSHLNSVCTEYVYDKSENARVCAKWQWNALDWCYWIALPASPVVQSSNTLSLVLLPAPILSPSRFVFLFYRHVQHYIFITFSQGGVVAEVVGWELAFGYWWRTGSVIPYQI